MAEINWDAIPLEERGSPFLLGLLKQPETCQLIAELSWLPLEVRNGGPPPWFAARTRALPLSEREAIVALGLALGDPIPPELCEQFLGL
jgi:hypothetical protein